MFWLFCTAVNSISVIWRNAIIPHALYFIQTKEMIKTVWFSTGADAIKKFTPSLGIPYLGV